MAQQSAHQDWVHYFKVNMIRIPRNPHLSYVLCVVCTCRRSLLCFLRGVNIDTQSVETMPIQVQVVFDKKNIIQINLMPIRTTGLYIAWCNPPIRWFSFSKKLTKSLSLVINILVRLWKSCGQRQNPERLALNWLYICFLTIRIVVLVLRHVIKTLHWQSNQGFYYPGSLVHAEALSCFVSSVKRQLLLRSRFRHLRLLIGYQADVS